MFTESEQSNATAEQNNNSNPENTNSINSQEEKEILNFQRQFIFKIINQKKMNRFII